ncbi:hypothetical protein AgCh_011215 [Apium graveolens]
MPFGLMNAPATFQSLMNDVFRTFLKRFVLVFFDDILIYSGSKEEHVAHLQTFLQKLKEHSLFANIKKCEFAKTTIAYLGHVILEAGVAVDQEKVKVVLEWSIPRNLRELRGFLGLTGYYRKFVANYAQLAQPLTTHLKKDSYGWSEDATKSFERFKAAMIIPPVLTLPDFSKLFVLEADALEFGLGAVLMQENRPLAFFSKLLVKPGIANRVADALSRKTKEGIEYGTMVTTTRINWAELDDEIAKDAALQRIRKDIQGGQRRANGVSAVVGGHAGELKTYLRMAGEWFWKECGVTCPTTSNNVGFVSNKKIRRASIVSDRDRIFLSISWKGLFRLQRTQLKRSTAYHPQTDGQIEIVNKGLKTYLRCFVGEKPKSWAAWLSWAEFLYNTSPHISTKVSPFKVLYRRDPPSLLRIGQGQTPVNSLDELLKERDAILDDLKFQLVKSHQRMKLAADNKRRDESFTVGEQVYLKLQPYRQKSLANRPYEKLAARFYGPFTVIQLIGKMAYKLDLPPTSRIHLVFHVSQLKHSIGSTPASSTIPEQLTPELEMVVEPEAILDIQRGSQVHNQDKMEVLVKWRGLQPSEATWEEMDVINQRFSSFHLEDKVGLQGPGNVITPSPGPIVKVYSRRWPNGKPVFSFKGAKSATQKSG